MKNKGKKIELDQKSEEWLEWRNYGIGASEAAIIKMEENYPYSGNIQKLWAVKSGIIEPEIISNKFTERGNELEPIAREIFIKRTGIYVEPMCYEHHYYEFIKASMDGISPDGEIICEIKCPSNPTRHQKALDGEIPEEYYTQIQHQFLVTGAKIGYFVSYFPNYIRENTDPDYRGNEDDFKIIKVNPNYAFIEELQRKLVKFWTYVERKILPTETAFDFEVDGKGRVGLVMISGFAQTGKDTLGKAFNRIYKSRKFGFADPLKEVYAEIAGVSLEDIAANKENHRNGLVALGAGMRKVFPDVWVKGLFRKETGIYEAMKTYGAYVSDVRYINEFTFGYLESKKEEVPNILIWIDSSERGNKPANEEEANTTSLLVDMAHVIVRNDMEVYDETLLEKAMDRIVLKIYQGQREIILSSVITEIGVEEGAIPKYEENTKRKKSRTAKSKK